MMSDQRNDGLNLNVGILKTSLEMIKKYMKTINQNLIIQKRLFLSHLIYSALEVKKERISKGAELES